MSLFLFTFIFTLTSSQSLIKSTLSFSGYGNSVTGGKNHPIYTVTTLEDNIPSVKNSLRYFLENGQSNRYLTFNTSGVIYLKSELVITGSNITIDGLSASYPGITIFGQEVYISGNATNYLSNTNGTNIVIQGLRFINSSDDNLRLGLNSHNIVITHCSFRLAENDALGYTEGAYNTTFSFNLIQITVPKAVLISYGGFHLSFHHNLFVNSNGRNPQVNLRDRYHSVGPMSNDIINPIADIQYNIIWNFGQGSRVQSSYNKSNATANFIANLYSSDDNYNAQKYIMPMPNNTQVFLCNNAVIQDCRSSNQSMTGLNVTSTNGISNLRSKMNAPKIDTVFGEDTLSESELLNEWNYVLNNVYIKEFDNSEENNARNEVIVPNSVSELWGSKYPWNDFAENC